MAQEPTETTSAQDETGSDDLIERARIGAGEWHCVPGYKWELRFLPPGANRGGERFEIRRVRAEQLESEYRQYLYTPDRPDYADSLGGAILHGDLLANDLPDSAEALANAAVRSLRERPPPRVWRRLAGAFEWLAPDFFGLHPKLSGRKRFAYSFAGSFTFFGMMALVMREQFSGLLDLRFESIVFTISFSLLTLFFAFICSRNQHWHSPVRVYLSAYLFPLIVWILASQIVGERMLTF